MAPEHTESQPTGEQKESQPTGEAQRMNARAEGTPARLFAFGIGRRDGASRHMAAGRRSAIEQTELIISGVLRGGVLVSAAVIGIGVVTFYARYAAAGGRGTSDSPFPHTVTAVVRGLEHGDPLAIIALGLLILLATPFTRVAVSILAFAVEHDWVYTAITVLVLLILIVSFLLGQGGA